MGPRVPTVPGSECSFTCSSAVARWLRRQLRALREVTVSRPVPGTECSFRCSSARGVGRLGADRAFSRQTRGRIRAAMARRRGACMPRRPRGHTDCRLHHITVAGQQPAIDVRGRRTTASGSTTSSTPASPTYRSSATRTSRWGTTSISCSTARWRTSRSLCGSSATATPSRTTGATAASTTSGRRFHAVRGSRRHAARAVCVYIAMNPVRAGLCHSPADWRYGSYPHAMRRRAAASAPRDRFHARAVREAGNDTRGSRGRSHCASTGWPAAARSHPAVTGTS